MKHILSDITYIDKENNLNTETIERLLTEQFGEIIRWAIVEVTKTKLKICFSYIAY